MEANCSMPTTPLAVLLSANSHSISQILARDSVTANTLRWRFVKLLFVCWVMVPFFFLNLAPGWLAIVVALGLSAVSYQLVYVRPSKLDTAGLCSFLQASFDAGQMQSLSLLMTELTDPAVSSLGDALRKLSPASRERLAVARGQSAAGQVDSYEYVALLSLLVPDAWPAACDRIYGQHQKQAEHALSGNLNKP